MARIGFIGLGHMGLPMAKRLLKAGHEVVGFDRATEPMRALKEAGGRTAGNLVQAATKQDVVITMLQTGDQVRSVCLEDEGLFQQMSAGALYIDCSTIDVDTSRAVHLEAKAAKVFMADAPVSGGVAGAEAGTLAFMLGGEEAVFEKAHAVLSHMGKTVLHLGPAGSGVAAKVCNNMILGISMIGVSEAFLLAEKLGLDAKKLHEIVTQSSGDCWVMSKYVPVPGVLPDVPANADYSPGFSGAMMLKDLRLAKEAAESSGVYAGIGAYAMALYEEASGEIGELDFSAIIKYIKMRSFK